MREMILNTVETRRFYSNNFLVPMEVEFHKHPPWADSVSAGYEINVDNVQGIHLIRLASRIVTTGSALPPISIFESHLVPIALSFHDVMRLAVALAAFGRFPTAPSYGSGDGDITKIIELVRSTLENEYVNLNFRYGSHRVAEEDNIETVTQHLTGYSIALSSSADLSFLKFVEVLDKKQRIFSYPNAGHTLLGASAFGSAYQLAIAANPVFAIEVALAGSVSYLVLKFGAAIGKKLDEIIEKW